MLKIQIKKNEHGNLSAIIDSDKDVNSLNTLFEFAYRKECGAWLFWLGRHNIPKEFRGPKKDFPMQFFKDACRAKYFLHPAGGIIPDEIKIMRGVELI